MQPEKSTKIDNVQEASFGDRLRSAFGTDEIPEIARKIGGTYQQVKNYIEGRLPKAEVLIQIRKSTNVDLNWLLTGIGEEPVDGNVTALNFYLEQDELLAITHIAQSSGESCESVMAMILREWLFERGQIESVDDKEMLIPVYQMMQEMPDEKRHQVIGRMMERTLKLATG